MLLLLLLLLLIGRCRRRVCCRRRALCLLLLPLARATCLPAHSLRLLLSLLLRHQLLLRPLRLLLLLGCPLLGRLKGSHVRGLVSVADQRPCVGRVGGALHLQVRRRHCSGCETLEALSSAQSAK